ncbi:unnamed protein product, partial [Oppiella nova]
VRDDDICTTPACEAAGKILKANLNETVDPCDDFYEFACGGWEASHKIPADRSALYSTGILQDQLMNEVKESLSKAVAQNDSNAVIYASGLYKGCIDEVTLNARGVTPLVESLNSVGGWPITGQSAAYDEAVFDWKDAFAKQVSHFGLSPIFSYEAVFDWKDAFAKQVSHFGLSPIFSVSVKPDANDTVTHRVYYDAPNFALGRNELVNMSAYPDIVKAYKQYILQSALLLGAKDDSQTAKDIEDLVAFESKLANFSLPQEKKRDSSVWYNRMTFEAFNQLSGNKIDWLNITNRIYKELNSEIRVKSDELVIVQDIGYYKSVTDLLEKTPTRVVANYLGWSAVMNLGSLTTKKFRDVVFNFNKVVSGVEKEAELSDDCISNLLSSIQYAVSRLYVDKNFTPKDKQEASNIISDIKDSYNELIKESDWLDESTKNKSL